MLANANSLFRLGSDPTFERRFSGPLQLQQDFQWRAGWGVLKANMLFVYNKTEEETSAPPFLLLIIEDCFIELCDENKIGKDFTFEIKFKSTARSFIFAADSFKSLGRWVSLLTISPIDYIQLSKQSFHEQIEQTQKKAMRD
ncbi:PH domain-containing protein [Caenorhabditis elegans]|uniref:PH domain-containing protein n=1 Tax=Caenorhabditis elegans TaxID=6239 RepID=Q7YTJ3_CAEEL|nr:PH domain-containing protein [Caenorhabditis elegans]CAE17975.1 PH domain-containing protein [Caenorhabditis elegans]|eukprot:NP_001022833.1 Uncharacterized protein CELE_Y37D8A.25 [Caenorhabditis elegans]